MSQNVITTNHSNESDHWDIEIKAKPRLLDIDLKELWRYRDLLAQFVRRDFVAAYKQTILGPLWHLADPLATTLTYAFIFGFVFNMSTNEMPRILFYLPGISLWTLFSNTLLSTSSTFNANAGIFGKVYFPRLIVPVNVAVNSLIAFSMQLLLFIVLVIIYLIAGANVRISWLIIFTPLITLLTTLIGLGLGMLLASVTNKYRDLSKLVSVSMRLMMFATPIIYPLSKIPEKYRWVIELNPMTNIVECFRYVWLGGNYSVSVIGLIYSIVIMIIVMVLGALVFNKAEKVAMDLV
ncbi:ABC transporter permease [Xanthocytophaga agilis]|uniref:Transport permease protein n=1 Tax=Xanthocytophaga agilis TaxID=3048010 RepID=A0AAE3R650_9BACT|nr:ABC transporter permease [Xanthocytophaga agilis]MDJ1502174.1 ABC transporter permease [Xanthocytophaga agilis]